MAPERSAWRPYFDALERAVGRPLESGVETGTFQDALALVTHLQVAVQRRLEQMSSDCLHMLNLVSSTDAENLELAAGHVGLLAGRKAAKETLPSIVEWLDRHSDRLRRPHQVP
jgi:hypothetical protein